MTMPARAAYASTLPALLAGGVALAASNDVAPVRAQDLLERGFAVVAEGYLAETIRCQETESKMHDAWNAPVMFRDVCVGAVTKSGQFQRLKNDDSEFVCVSFRDWACYPSRAQN